MRIALVGNPNCGKTTLFNRLTGSNQVVGNWPGVTVERKQGLCRAQGQTLEVVDLPGIYALSTFTLEERIARDYLVSDGPEVIVNLLDAASLSRGLYLTSQLLELGLPVVVALNMMDEARARGDRLDPEALSAALGAPVCPISARTGEGVEALLSCALAGVSQTQTPLHSPRTEAMLTELTGLMTGAAGAGLTRRDAALQIADGGEALIGRLHADPAAVATCLAAWAEALGEDDPMVLLARERYAFVDAAVAASYVPAQTGPTPSDRIDRVLTHPVWGIPLFAAMMLGLFFVVFGPVGSFLSDGAAYLLTRWVQPLAEGLLAACGASEPVRGLVIDGALSGVGSVLTFLPQIALLFFCLSLLEDSGYLARAAFLMDRGLAKLGLSGKSFVPLLMGYGCTVPAALAARTMDSDRSRRMTLLLLPGMSCSAKLPVYGLIASAFFPEHRVLAVMSLYLLGLALALVTARLLRATLFKKGASLFLLELPAYRRPTLNSALMHVYEQVKHFVVKAGTVIFLMSMVIWALTHFTGHLAYTEDPQASLLGMLGVWIAPALIPLGCGAWQLAVALLSGLVAKEAVVSTLGLLLGFTQAGASAALALAGCLTPLSAYAFLVFVLLYTPCAAAMATLRRELGSRRWALALALYQTGLAYLVACLIYQGGRLLGLA